MSIVLAFTPAGRVTAIESTTMQGDDADYLWNHCLLFTDRAARDLVADCGLEWFGDFCGDVRGQSAGRWGDRGWAARDVLSRLARAQSVGRSSPRGPLDRDGAEEPAGNLSEICLP